MENLSLIQDNYGSVRRFYVQTLDDQMLSPDIQEKMVRENPPRGVYKIKGSDHCPFFSKPQSLNKILLEIIQLTWHNSESTAYRFISQPVVIQTWRHESYNTSEYMKKYGVREVRKRGNSFTG